MKLVMILIILVLAAGSLSAAPPPPDFASRYPHALFAQSNMNSSPIQFQNAGTPIGVSYTFNCSTGTACALVSGVLTLTATGGGGGTVTSVATTSPITGGTFTTTGTIACATCTTNASALTSNALVKGAGGQATQTSGITDNGTAITMAETIATSAAGALSTGNGPALSLTGAPITGGSGTTTVPLFYVNAGNAPSSWNTVGTEFGINAPSGWAGNFIEFHLNGGGALFNVSSSGVTRSAGYSNNNNHVLISFTAPTVAAAGCGGSGASITANNGTAAFKVNVGTSNIGTCTITMSAATTDWICSATDITTTSTAVSQTKSKPGGTPTTQITLQNYTDISGTGAWVDNDVIAVSCFGE